MFDTMICGGTVIDGTGRPGFRADVGITAGKIAALGSLSAAQAGCVIDASGRAVTPGFIDIHRHADAAAFRPGYGELELRQGLTTIVNGNCGLSAAPFGEAHAAAVRAYLRPITGDIPADMPSASMADYLAALHELPLHTGMLAGAGILRADAAGYELEHLADAHYRAIHRAMERALADGALGISLGLGYAPECFYTTEELIRALEPLRGQDIPLTVHMRQEGAGVCDSIEEMLLVARELRVPLHIRHLKAMGRDNWGKKIPRVLELLHRAKEEGLEVYSCNGTPVDCVIVGCNALNFKPDAIITGVNHGYNLGMDIHYSGTVSAAKEGALMGIPSMAVSMCNLTSKDFSVPARVAAELFDGFIASGSLLYNVNVPDLAYGELKGIKFTGLSKRTYYSPFEKRVDPRGCEYYWWPMRTEYDGDMKADNDERWTAEGFVSVTPILTDFTDYAALKRLNK